MRADAERQITDIKQQYHQSKAELLLVECVGGQQYDDGEINHAKADAAPEIETDVTAKGKRSVASVTSREPVVANNA